MALYQHRFLGHTAAGENWMFTWWADSSRSTGDAHVASIAWVNALFDGATAGNGLEDHMATAVGLDSVTTVLVDTATGVQISRMDGAVNRDGVSLDNTLPSDVALVASLRTATPTRSGRGRFFLPPAVVTDVTAGGRVQADLVADVTASLEAAWTGYNSASDRPVIYSRTQRVTRNVVSFDVGDLFDTQRGREGNLVEARTSLSMP
jgi:hypothetical protein